MRVIGFFGVFCLLLAFVIAPAEANACSCAGPDPVIFTANGNVPVDLGGVAVWRDNSFREPPIEVERWVDGVWVSEDVETQMLAAPGGLTGRPLIWVRPSPFAEGDRFRIDAGDGDLSGPVEVEINVTAPLGTVEGQPTLVVGDEEAKNVSVDDNGGGGCSVPAWSATRRLNVKLPSMLEPYRDLLLYETTVDGATWRPRSSDCGTTPTGRSWQREPGVDLLAALCECGSDGVCDELLEEGPAEVQVHAFFPGSPHPVWSSAAVQTSLTCPTDCVEFAGWEIGFVPCGGEEEKAAGGCSTTPGSMRFGLLLLAACILFRRQQSRTHKGTQRRRKPAPVEF